MSAAVGFSWHGYERTWRSDAWWVDLRPDRDLLEWGIKRRARNAERYDAKGSKQHFEGMGPTAAKHATGWVTELAVAKLLDAPIPEVDAKNAPDIRTRRGDLYEVKGCQWRGSSKYPPQMLSNRGDRHIHKQEKHPTIWAVCKPFPWSLEGAWVVGWMEPWKFIETRVAGTGKVSWAWVNQWVDDGRWRHIAEIMLDEGVL